MSKVLYPGSFDPITKGHMNIIEQATDIFDEVVVAILNNPLKKTSFFTPEERLEMIQELYAKANNVKVVLATGATVDVATLHKCKAIVRGLRSISDFDYEAALQQINKDISKGTVRTIGLFADAEYQFVSSTVVKEVFGLNKDIAKYVDPIIKERMLTKKGTI